METIERTVLSTPYGAVEVCTDAGRLRELNFTDRKPTRSRGRNRIVRELERYFRGEPVAFEDIEVDLRRATEFERRVYEATRSIPRGRVATYGEIARAIGRPNAQRAVGQALGKNPVAIVIPCHRVVASDGLGGFSSPLRWKKHLLRLEGALPRIPTGKPSTRPGRSPPSGRRSPRSRR